MAPVTRTAQFAKVFKILKKHFEGVKPVPDRSVFESLLYACCLEDAHYPAADEAYAALIHTFFDFNEIRVTTIAELSEVMAVLPDPRAASNRLKRVLQSVFEATYSFDLEERRKKNIGPTIKWLHELDGTTNFSVSYVVQSALGGHAIPVDSGVLAALGICGLVSDKDIEAGVVPGLERAIAKSKGIEFASMLHQLGADFKANPYSPKIRKVLLQIDPECEGRIPKRRTAKKAKKKTKAATAQKSSDKPAATKKPKKAAKEKKASTAKKKPAAAKKSTSAAREKKAADAKSRRSASAGISKRKPR